MRYIKLKKYNLDTLPDNLRIKLHIQKLYNIEPEDIFEKCEKKFKELKI
jgi:hypothetical protein